MPAEFHGLIQHSFSLRLPKQRQPFTGVGVSQQVEKLFGLPAHGGAAFEVKAIGEDVPAGSTVADHSPLVKSGSTTVHPLRISFSGAKGDTDETPLPPPAFGWSRERTGTTDAVHNGPTFVFAEVNPANDREERNDYLVERRQCGSGAHEISRVLLEILAHKRSRLLALALANRIVSVMLPHAILTPADDFEAGKPHCVSNGPWFVQPLLSFIRNGQSKAGFRDSYSLTLLLVPITANRSGQRKMTEEEIDLTVNAGWGLGAFPNRTPPPRFEVRGPLREYLPRLAAPLDPAALLWPDTSSTAPASASEGRLTMRQGTEVLAYCLARKLATASVRTVDAKAARRIGDEVVTALGSARVSSVLVVDDELAVEDIRAGDAAHLPRHHDLMAKIARETRRPAFPAGFRQYRLDRALVDDDAYVVGVVPTKRCVVVSCAGGAQHGWYQSGLMQAGSITHMTIGAASAIGTLGAIDRDLEEVDDAEPDKITAIDGEIATDLRELYDLDITSESYRRLYRLLRRRLGITRDYQALEEKMMALYRATSTKHEVETQKRLARTNRMLILISIFIFVVGLLALFKVP